ncbi:MAG: serine/threonine-protein kinase, partial [Cyanobacteria bacterium J06636_16]
MNGRPNSLLHNRYRIVCSLESEHEEFEQVFIARAQDSHSLYQHKCLIRQLKLNTSDSGVRNAVWGKFEDEANILIQLRHPQIAEFHDYFEEEGYFYIVQKLVEGQSLEERIRQTGPLSSAQVGGAVLHLLPVLEHLHRNRIIHRNIKPNNIVFCPQSGKLILTNFGVIEQSFKAFISPSKQLSDANSIGSLGFIAPEQRVRRATYSSDLYSLGITAVYLLTGKLPGEIEKDPQTSQLFWQEHISDVNPHLAAVLNRAIQFDPNNRYDTADDMLQALQLQSAGESFTTMQDFLHPDSETSASTRTSLFSAITLADQSKTVGLVQSTPSRHRGRSLGLLTAGAVVLLASGASIAYVGMSSQRSEVTSQSQIEGQVLEKAVAPVPSSEELEASASVSLREAQTLQSQGKYPEAVAAALEVAPTSSMATQAQQLVVHLTHIPLNATLDEVLPPQNVEARKIKFLEGTIEDPQLPVVTKFGESQIDANKVAWQ